MRIGWFHTGRDDARPATWKDLGGLLPAPLDDNERTDLLWQEFEAHFWNYNQGATTNRFRYQLAKITTLIVAATVTVLAATGAPAAVTASLAGSAVVLGGAEQLYQWHSHWLSYRSSAETLRRQAFAYVAGVSPYDDPLTRRRHLASVLQEVTASENAAWAETMTRDRDANPRGS
jgi:hypothetical protein